MKIRSSDARIPSSLINLSRALLFAGCLLLGITLFPALLKAEWYIEVPRAGQSTVGTSRLGPYSTRAEAESVNQQYFGGGGSITGSGDSGSSSGDGGDYSFTNLFNNILHLLGADKTREEKATEVNNKAVEYAKKGDRETAYRLYLEALRLNPDDQTIRKNISITLTELGHKAYHTKNYRLAAQRYEEALTYDPGNLNIKNCLQAAKELLGDETRLAGVKPKLEKMLDQFAAEVGGKGSAGTSVGGTSRVGSGAGTGYGDSSVVDLTFLDPNKPISVDPYVVKGKPRVFLVQPGTCTPKGEDYDRGFEELKKHNPAAALEFFKRAETENPDNPLVRNAMDLTKDMIKMREDAAKTQAEREQFLNARMSFLDATVALRKGDVTTADNLFYNASTLNRNDRDIQETTRMMGMYLYWAKKGQPAPADTEEQKKLYAAVAERGSGAMLAMLTKNYEWAIAELDAADAAFADNFWWEQVNKIFEKEKPLDENTKAARKNTAMMRSGLNDARRELTRILEKRNKEKPAE